MVKPVTERPAERSDSKYKGVRKRKWGKWVSEIRLPNSRERIWLGSYDAPEKAARAFDAALFCLRGRAAKFNFPENPPNIVGGRSLTPSEIQVAASRFANPEGGTSSSQSRDHNLEHSSSSSSELQMEESASASPSPSVSDGAGGAAQLDTSFLDVFSRMGNSENNVSDFGIFPGFDDLSNDFFAPLLPPPSLGVDYGEENCDGEEVFPSQHSSFLWNF